MQSCSVLEEYLKEDYIQTVSNNSINNNSSITKSEEMAKLHSNYFFHNGTYDYVIFEHEYKENGESKVEFLKIRLINKNNLNEDLKKQLEGGDANGGERDAYLNFKDVYGVTDDLSVFYCNDGISSAIGANYLDSSPFDNSAIIYDENSVASKALAETGSTSTKDLTISDLRGVSELVVSNLSGAVNLEFLVDMPNLTKLTLNNYQGSLSGLGYPLNLNSIYFNNDKKVTNINYSGLDQAKNLIQITFYNPNDTEVQKMCLEMSKSNYNSLKQISLTGYLEVSPNFYISNFSLTKTGPTARSELTSISDLNLLKAETKASIEVLFVNNNRLQSLDGIQGFVNLKKLYACNNSFGSNSLEVGDYVSKLLKLTILHCGYSNIENDDFSKLSVNTKIEYLSIPRK